jgi:hypothetical protein
MLTEDYIMRMINQALVVLRRILQMKATGQHQQALQEIEQALEQLLGLKTELVKHLDDESIFETLTHNEKLDTDRLFLVAELFKEEGEILAELGRVAESTFSRIRALNFYLEVALDGNLERFPPPHEKISDLLQKLDGVVLEPATKYPLYIYYEQENQYAAAEHTLTDLANEPDLVSEALNELRSFYERLLEKSAEELAESGFSGAQIREKLDKIQNDKRDE